MTADKLKKHVHETFEHIRKALDIRERLLTRQIDVLASNPNHRKGARQINLIDQMKFIAENEANVLKSIRIFGKFNIDNYNFYNDTTFAIEDYICPNADHELMYKCLNNDDNTVVVHPLYEDHEGHDDDDDDDDVQVQDEIIVDFSQNQQLINVNNHLNESIVNMTISESKELIDKTNNLTKFEELMYDGLISPKPLLDDDEDANIANLLIKNLQQDHVTTPSAQKTVNNKKPKRKIKIHNYNGTINLKNISNLTINTNCNREPSIRHQQQQQQQHHSSKTPKSAPTSNSITSTLSSSIPATVAPSSVDIEDVNGSSDNNNQSDPDPNTTSYNCEFYNRLLNEIKHNFTIQTAHGDHHHSNNIHIPLKDRNSIYTTSPSTTTTSSLSSSSSVAPVESSNGGDVRSCNKMLFNNIRNLKITIPVTATKNQPNSGQSHKSSAAMTGMTTTTSAITTSASSTDDMAPNQLELDDNFNHPVQIEEWLKQIILETEIEPMQNTEILEHSIIHNNNRHNANATMFSANASKV